VEPRWFQANRPYLLIHFCMRDRIAISYAILAICVFKFLVWTEFILFFSHPTQLVAQGQKSDFIVRESHYLSSIPLTTFQSLQRQEDKEQLLISKLYEETRFHNYNQELHLQRREARLVNHRHKTQTKLNTHPLFVFLPFVPGSETTTSLEPAEAYSYLFN
jgi:hypothetical protein